MIKKLLITIALLALAFSAVGCGAAYSNNDMQIAPAKLTDQESKIVKLVQDNHSNAIFDFTVDQDVRSFSTTCWQLDEKGKWAAIHTMNNPVTTQSGDRIAISFDNIGDGMRLGIQNGGDVSANELNTNQNVNIEGMSKTTSLASSAAKIEYEKEIPLAMQIITSKQEVMSYEVDSFYTPEKYQDLEYEHVYANNNQVFQDRIKIGRPVKNGIRVCECRFNLLSNSIYN